MLKMSANNYIMLKSYKMRKGTNLKTYLKRELIFLICITLSVPLRAQQLFFVRATVENSVVFDTPPPVQLLLYTPQINSVLTVYKDFTKNIHTSSYDQLKDVIYYPRLGAFCITNREKGIYLLRVNNPDTLINIVPQCPTGYDLPDNLSVIKNYWVYDCYNHDALQRKDVFLYRGIDSTLNSKLEVSPNDFKDIYITGKNSMSVVIKPYDRHLYLPVVADTVSRPALTLELAQQYMVSKKKFSALVVNDDTQVMIAIRSENPQHGEKYGYNFGAVYSKKDGTWFEVSLKGNALNISSYGCWLAGAVADGIDFDAKYVPDSKASPGRSVRDSAKLPYQFEEWEINSGNIYAPGILYLLNTQTQQYIEWNTGQGDSEILLVQNEVVYYRVFDEIYKVNIVNGKKLGKSQLLVKSIQVVPFIHWAFISPAKLDKQ